MLLPKINSACLLECVFKRDPAATVEFYFVNSCKHAKINLYI